VHVDRRVEQAPDKARILATDRVLATGQSMTA
jgi:hypothetical protein